MKRMLMGILTLAVVGACAVIATAQGNPRGTAKLTLNGKEITVEYGRPSLKGRSMDSLLGQLPAGEAWRLGADKSTTFTTGTGLAFGDVTVPKGEYSLWVVKQADGSYKLAFNSQHGQWGTANEHANRDPAKDVASVPLKVEKEGNAEQVTIQLEKEGDGGEVSIQWGNMELSAPFKAK